MYTHTYTFAYVNHLCSVYVCFPRTTVTKGAEKCPDQVPALLRSIAGSDSR